MTFYASEFCGDVVLRSVILSATGFYTVSFYRRCRFSLATFAAMSFYAVSFYLRRRFMQSRSIGDVVLR